MEEGNIKRGLKIYLYYWTIVVFLIFLAINYFSKNVKLAYLNSGLMTSVVTFLFGFLININFSMIFQRFNALRTDLAQETGILVSMFNFSKKLGEKFHNEIIELIDQYTIVTLKDYTNYTSGRQVYYRFFDKLELAEIKSDFQKSAFGNFSSSLRAFGDVRERLEYLTGKNTLFTLKLSTYFLGIILIGLLFVNREDFFTNSLFVVLSTLIVFIFLIIEDYDDLRIEDYTINISNSEQLFDLIGKERYYPENLLSEVKLEKGKSYRIGIYDKKEKVASPSKDGGNREKIFKITYNPGFNSRLKNIKLINKK